jgi:hypothetical protein
VKELRPGKSVKSDPKILVQQLQQLVDFTMPADGKVGAPSAMLKHFHVVFESIPPTRLLSEVILPALSLIAESKLMILLLILFEWIGSWKEAQIKDVGRQLSEVRWVPTEDGSTRAIVDCFDPEESPQSLGVVSGRRAKLDTSIKDANVQVEVVWKVLRLCGIKTQITWEDAIEEAKSVMQNVDFYRAGILFAHLDKHHSSLRGNRSAALTWLQREAWVPSTGPSTDPSVQNASQLLSLSKMFPVSSRNLVWAVAPSLFADSDPSMPELKPRRNIGAEPAILVEQVCTVMESNTLSKEAAFDNLRLIFAALKAPRPLVEVVVPVSTRLKKTAESAQSERLRGNVISLFLVLFEWIGSWKEEQIKEVGKQLSEVRWIPTEDGEVRTIVECFVPKESPHSLRVVAGRIASLDANFKDANVKVDVVWKVLRLCGMKTQITWEDAIEEAKLAMQDVDIDRAGMLFAHLDEHHSSLHGNRSTALSWLQQEAWIPSAGPSTESSVQNASQLLSLSKIFPVASRCLIWAVAPSLFADSDPSMPELKPRRSVEAEPGILVEQVCTIMESSTLSKEATFDNLQLIFGAMKAPRLLTEVLVPVSTRLIASKLSVFLLTFLEYAEKVNKDQLGEIGKKLSAIHWIPAEDGSLRSITDCFDPERSPKEFSVVRRSQANMKGLAQDAGVSMEVTLRVVRICGLKVEMSWEDVVEEATDVAQESHFERAQKLFQYVDKQHLQFPGNRAAALEKLK